MALSSSRLVCVTAAQADQDTPPPSWGSSLGSWEGAGDPCSFPTDACKQMKDKPPDPG